METSRYFDPVQFVIAEIQEDPTLIELWFDIQRGWGSRENFAFPDALFLRALEEMQRNPESGTQNE